MTTPTISTSRLCLRPLIKATPRNLVWLRDPEVVRYSEQRHQEHTFSTQLRYVNSFGGNSRIWSINVVDTGDHIGNLAAVHDEPNNVSDIGIMIGDKDQWNKGYGREAWSAVCVWLLDRDYGAVRKLEAGCARSNEHMLRLLRTSGFTQEGERLGHFLFDGNPISMVLFGRVR